MSDEYRVERYNDHHARPEHEEEAHLLPTAELEFEDNESPTNGFNLYQTSVRRWCSRPNPPRPQRVKPLLPAVQEAPIRLLERILPNRVHQTVLLVCFIVLWAIAFAFFLRTERAIKDGNGEYIVNLDCTDTLWRRKNECGLDGVDCRPFSDSTFSFRCPANCAGVQVLNPRAVGPIDVTYRPLVIGSQPYRGDSFICGAGIHAGIVSDSSGGCGRVLRAGTHDNFPSTKAHGIESIPFGSYFPLSFQLEHLNARCGGEPRSLLLLISIFFTVTLSVFMTAPEQFFILFILIFAHVSFVSDPPSASYHNTSVLPDHLSRYARGLLPALFVAVVLYKTCIKRVLDGLTAQIEKTILWLGGFWIGALSNYTFAFLPIQRLTAHDIEQQPGAKLALAIILILLACIVVQQIHYFWLEGRLGRYLALYGTFLVGIGVCLVLPGVQLRIHHYIIGLLLLPGTSLQTRPSLLYQGILLGLFVNGIARWDFDSVLQTADELRADASLGSAIPSILEPLIAVGADSANISFFWGSVPGDVDGVSVLVNDVERYRSFFSADGAQAVLNGQGLKLPEGNFTWSRRGGLGLPEFFRFAFMNDGETLDYSKPGTWFANGSWTMGAE